MHCGNLNDFLNPLFWYTLINSPTYGTNYLWSNTLRVNTYGQTKTVKNATKGKTKLGQKCDKRVTFHKDYFLKFFYVYKN